MTILRVIVAILPQLLILLLLGGKFDLLGGWNHTDLAFSILILLFLVTPVATAMLLIIEVIRFRKKRSSGGDTKLYSRRGLALFLFVEALVINISILSQLRMH